MNIHKLLRPGILTLAGLAATVGVLWIGLTWIASGIHMPSFDEVRGGYSKTEAVLLDRHRQVIHELRVDPHGRRLDWVPLEEISPALRAAIIASEDRRYFSHRGADWRALFAASMEGLRGSARRGASTITMQLAARLDNQAQPEGSRRSAIQKIRQIAAARQLERGWSKQQILETYLNLVTFRGELQGIGAASMGLFSKRPHGLDSVESAILAALVRSPNAAAESVASRTRALLAAMQGPLDTSQVDRRVRDVLLHPYELQPQAALAPHVARKLLGERVEPRQVVCTLDGALQRFVSEVLRYHLMTVRNQNVHDGAVLVADNQTGEVLAYVGNTPENAGARYVDGIQALRQAGSALKPFLYGIALEQRLLTPASLIDDSPVDIPVTGGVYRPKNYDRTFRGPVTVRTALASSLNVPAVRILNIVGVESFVDRLSRFGFRALQSADYYGPSLALGSADVCLWDLVNAYRTLANQGVWSPMRLSFSEPASQSRRVMGQGAAFLIGDVLSDRESRSETFTLESPLGTRFWTAVKTGTSKDMRDNWCVGYSNLYTVGVWAGNFSGEPMWNVTGVTGAAPVWAEVMNWLHRSTASTAPKIPTGVVAQNVDITGTGRREWFLEGTQTDAVRPALSRHQAHIVYPAEGTVVALDPDIPADQQKVFFEAEPAGDLRWALDDNPMGPANSLTLWRPSKGRHTLSLLDSHDRVMDTVHFEVRGNE